MLFRFTLLVASLIAIPCSVSADPQKSDEKRLQGEWRIEKLEVRGKSAPPEFLKTGKYVFSDKKLAIFQDGNEVGVSKFTLDPSKTPKTIDMTATKGEGQGTTMLGIYRFEKKKLILCIGKDRPTKFTGAGKAGLLYLKHPEKD
jgi:uncharacterized protein (TIGR03067 family)